MGKDKRKYSDRADYLKKAVAKRRKQIRQMAIEYKGSKCAICGYNNCLQALEFHHIIGDGKDFGISIKDIPGAGKKLKMSLISAYYYARIVIVKCTKVLRSFHE